MKRIGTMLLTVFAVLFAMPGWAWAVTDEIVVPGWLSYGAGLVGLAMAVLLLVDALLLRRVSEGSMIADNIMYMMLGVVCLAASVLVRWGGSIEALGEVKEFASFAADLLTTAGMALMAVYFVRVRTAMTRYLRSVTAYQESAGTGEE